MKQVKVRLKTRNELVQRVMELERQMNCRCHCTKPCRSCYEVHGLQEALSKATRTGQHGHVMTAEGYPVRLVATDVRSGRVSGIPEPLLGLLLYPMGHEISDYWSTNGTNNSPRGKKNLIPYDKKHLEEGFYRYGRDVLKDLP